MSFEKYFKTSFFGGKTTESVQDSSVCEQDSCTKTKRKKSLEKTGVVRSVILKKSCPHALADTVRCGGELFKNVAGSVTC